MYCDMFGLHTAPFNNTPDPRFFFNTPDHEEALASLQYVATQRKGFVLVTGEVGSGKTLLARMLTSRLPAGSKTAVINNTRLTGRELLASVCREFEIDMTPEASTGQLIKSLEDFLLQQYGRDRLAVVILDEAQNLPSEAFEELRLLGNLEADDAKLLQVLILGQPELQATFRRPELRQIAQRIFRGYHLKGMNQELTAGYIRHRLVVAGVAPDRLIFDPHAVKAVFRHSQGVPRLVNQICDNAMLAAFADSKPVIDAQIIQEVVDQLVTTTDAFNCHADESRHAEARSPVGRPHGTDSTIIRPDQNALDQQVVRDNFHELFENIRAQGTEAAERSREVAEQQRGEFEEWRLQVQALADQLRQRIRSMDERLKTVDAYIAEQATPIADERRQLRDQVRTAMEAMSRSQAQLDAELKRRREESERFSEGSRRLLTETREQAAALLAGMRLHLGEAVEETASSWRKVIDDGKADAAQLESRVQAARDQATVTETELKKAIHSVKGALAQVDSNSGLARQEITRRTEQACHEIAHISKHHQKTMAESFEADKQRLESTIERVRASADSAITYAQSAENRIQDSMSQWKSRVGECHEQVETDLQRMREELEKLTSAHQQTAAKASELTNVLRSDLDETLRATQQAVGTLQQHGQSFTAALMQRLGQCARQAKQAQGQAEAAVDEITRTREDSLAQLRSAFAQMHERAEHERVDLVTLAEEVREIAGQCVERVRSLRSEESGRLESLAETTAKLLQQATATLTEVTTVSRNATDESRRTLEQAEQTRRAVEDSRQRVREIHAEALALLQESATSQASARVETHELLEELHVARRSLDEAHHVPRELIEEARRKAEALSELAQRITTVYQKLNSSQLRAAAEQQSLDQSTEEATTTLKQLKLHAQRVGQLVGIIRQVYGAMDARVEKIARGLTSAEEIFRVVPREMDAMREALGAQGARPSADSATQRPPHHSARRGNLTSGEPKVLPRPKNVSELPFAKGTLGEIVQRNQQLNTWLKGVLDLESEASSHETGENRMTRSSDISTREISVEAPKTATA